MSNVLWSRVVKESEAFMTPIIYPK